MTDYFYRWIVLKNSNNKNHIGIRLNNDGSPSTGYGFNVSNYSIETLEVTKHDFELGKDDCVHVHIDGFMMGVGGYDSWTPNVDSQFLFQPDGVKGIETKCILSIIDLM